MKRIVIIILGLISFAYAQNPDTPFIPVKVPTPMAANYWFKQQLWIDSVLKARKAVFSDSVGFKSIVTVPTLSADDSSRKVINSAWIKQNLSGLTSGAGTNRCANSLTGGRVTWNSLLIFDVTRASYCIGGTTYTSQSDTVHLATADATNPRIDVIAVDTFGMVVVIKGTAAADPAVPQVDPASQYFLTSVLVPAGATTPSGVSAVVLWNENIGSPEWTASNTGAATVNFNNLVTPYVGTKSTDAGSFSNITANRHFIKYTGTAYSTSTYNNLKFFIRLKAALAAGASIYVTLYSNSVAVTAPLLIGANQGLDKTITGNYQGITCALTDFAFTTSATTINAVVIQTVGTGTGFFIDYMTLTGGVTTYTPTQITLTTTGTSGPAQLLGNVLNIPNYAGGGSTDTTSLSNRINLKQNLVTLTTTGTSGAATFNQSTGALNIPAYAGGGGGSVTASNSVLKTGDDLTLVNDSTSFVNPYKFYGWDGTTRGWKDGIKILLTNPKDNDLIKYDSVNSRFVNVAYGAPWDYYNGSVFLGVSTLFGGVNINQENDTLAGGITVSQGTNARGGFHAYGSEYDTEHFQNNAGLGSKNNLLIYANSDTLNGTTGKISFLPSGYAASLERLNLTYSGASFNRSAVAAAWVHIGAGTTTSPPIIIESGALNTTPIPGALEYIGTDLYFTFANGSRVKIATQEAGCITTNMLEYSEEFNNAAWGLTGTTITANATLAPDNITTADKLVEASGTSQHRVVQGEGAIAAGQYTFSVYAKQGERTLIWVGLSDNITGDAIGYFDLAAGTFTAGSSSTHGTITGIIYAITAADNGFYRCSVTATTNSGTSVAGIIGTSTAVDTISFAGSVGDGVYLWGAQMETGTLKCYKKTP